MTENHEPFVSPDRLSRPEQADLIASAGVRNAVDYAGMRNALASLYPQLEHAPMRVNLSTEPAYQNVYSQPAPQPVYEQPAQPVQYRAPAPVAAAQSYLEMPAYQPAFNTAPQQSQYNGDGASMDLHVQPSAAEIDTYLDGLAKTEPVPEFAPAPSTDWQQPIMNDDANIRAEEARRMAEEAHGPQSNYGLAA